MSLPLYDSNKSYFEMYWSLYQANEQLMTHMGDEAEERDAALRSILKIELFYNNQENLERIQQERYLTGRKKHNRRCAADINRGLSCPYEHCGKSYGSEGSLNLHIKTKHNGGNKTDRERLARYIVVNKAEGIDVFPQIDWQFNLPPGIIERACEENEVQLSDEAIDYLESEI